MRYPFKFIQNWFDDMEISGEYENIDNERFAQAGDPVEVAAYEKKRNTGCCGAIDQILADDCGHLWLAGFNYGH